MSEEWRIIPGLDGRFEVSDLGRVRHAKTLRVRKLQPHPRGYLMVNLYHPTNPRRYAKVHQLVLEAFVGPRPPGMGGCHYNDIPSDNRLENLRWDTQSANAQDMLRNGGHRSAGATHCKNGHEYTPDNTRISTNGGRRCRACSRARASDYAKRNRKSINARRRQLKAFRREAA